MHRVEISVAEGRYASGNPARSVAWGGAAILALAWSTRLSSAQMVHSPLLPYWWLLAIGFGVAYEIKIEFRPGHPFGAIDLGDVLLVWGLISLPPAYVVLSCVTGTLGFAVVRRKSIGHAGVLVGRAALASGSASLVFVSTTVATQSIVPRELIAAVMASVVAKVVTPLAGLAAPHLATLQISLRAAALTFASTVAAGAGGAGLAWVLSREPAGEWLPLALAASLPAYWALIALQARKRKLRFIWEFSENLQGCKRRSDVLSLLATCSGQLANASRSMAAASEPGGAIAVASARRGRNATVELLPAASQPLLSQLAGCGETRRISPWTKDPVLREHLRRWGAAEMLVIPLSATAGRIGTLVLLDKGDAGGSFSATDSRLCRILANQAGTALHNHLLTSELRAEVCERQHTARHDSLTGLLNRTAFLDAAKTAIDSRIAGDVAIVVVGLHSFHDVNEALGHYYGDLLLSGIGERLRSTSSGPMARLDGDTFAICLSGIPDRTSARARAERIRETLIGRGGLDGMPVEVSATLGLALASQHGRSPELLLRRARAAMRRARYAETPVQFCDGALDSSLPRKLLIAHDLRRALESDGLVLHYQPIVSLQTSEVVGTEALLRWPHPRYGLLSPEEFIPVAEKDGLIRQMTRWVLKEATNQAVSWRRQGFGGWTAVNLSAAAAADPLLLPSIEELLSQTRLPPSALVLELTESSMLEDQERTVQALESIARRGIAIALDDFGTGYSSLSHLSSMPVQLLKVDKSFVATMETSAPGTAIVRSTIALAQELGLGVIAEGIEDQHSFTLLGEMGAHYGQGFHISRPLAGSQLLAWLASRSTRCKVSDQ